MAGATEANIALLIDADNASPDHLDEVLLVLGEFGSINIRRAYGNWEKSSLKTWGELSARHSMLQIQQRDVTKRKNATDMRMTIDAMDLLLRGHVKGFGIMSDDSDFLPLAQRIREEGIPVYGFGTAKAPEGFKQACTRFFDMGALRAANLADNGSNAAEPRTAIDPEVVKLLGSAWKASKRNAEGYAALSEVGQRFNAVTSLSARNYGYSRLVDLVRATGIFDVKVAEGGGLLVKRQR